MTWAEVADAVFRRDEAWLRANLPADFPRPDPLYGLFHVEAVEAWARRRWGVVREAASPDTAAVSPGSDSAAKSEPACYRVVKLAERWGCSDGKVRALLKKGVLPALDLDGLVRIPIAAVRAYEATCEIKPGPAPAEAEAVTDAALRDAALHARARRAARRSQARKSHE